MNDSNKLILFQWHYESHYARELERIDNVRVKKNPGDFPDRETRRTIRNSAVERIKRRRYHRESRPALTSREDGESSSELICPSCNLPICNEDYSNHVENCLATRYVFT